MDFVLLVGIFLATFISRIINLLAIPFFTDEAIYIRWAQIGLADPVHRFISLTDGKQPLLTWLMYPMLKLFSDPLFAGRMVSVFSGSFSCVGIYLVGRTLFTKRVGALAALAYFLSPFTFVYDRLALMDSLVSMFGIWSIYISILLAKSLRLDTALLLGMIAGLGTLTKSSAFFFIFNLPFTFVFLPLKKKELGQEVIKFIGLGLVSVVIVQVMYNILRLSPWFYLVRQKNYSFVLTASEFLHSPFSLFISNLHGLIPWMIGYFTVPFFLVCLFGLICGFYKRKKEVLYLFVWFLVPFIFLASFGKVIFPRFLLFMIYPFFVIGAYGIDQLLFFVKGKRVLKWGILGIVFLYPAFVCFTLLTRPINADIPQTDRNQLMDDWPSGYGVNQVVEYITQKGKNEKIVLGTEGTFGLFPAVFEIYLKSNPNIEINGYWPVSSVPVHLLESAKLYPTYLVFKEKQQIPGDWPLTLVAKYPRGVGQTYLLFYQVQNRVQ